MTAGRPDIFSFQVKAVRGCRRAGIRHMPKTSRFVQVSVLLFGIAVAASGRLADFSAPEQGFQQLPEDTKTEIVRLLIATGDFNGIYHGQFSRRLAAAVENFQSREGFPPTGLLPSNQLATLRAKGTLSSTPQPW
jgi:peptidoglycan hydrolase-like protein with peptidoglycan-binding domain